MRHYLYRHIRSDKNVPFYIGIGTKRKDKKYSSFKTEYARAFDSQLRSNLWNKITNKTSYKVEIMMESNDYDFIKEKEKEFISLYKRKNLNEGELVNLTDGGDGCLNMNRTSVIKKLTGRKRKPSVINKMRNNRTDRKEILKIDKHKDLVLDEYKSIRQAGFENNSDPGIIGRIANNLKGTSKGFRWIFKKDYNEGLLSKYRGNASKKRVIQLSLDDKIINTFESLTEASKKTNTALGNISNCCTNKLKTAGGYKWKHM